MCLALISLFKRSPITPPMSSKHCRLILSRLHHGQCFCLYRCTQAWSRLTQRDLSSHADLMFACSESPAVSHLIPLPHWSGVPCRGQSFGADVRHELTSKGAVELSVSDMWNEIRPHNASYSWSCCYVIGLSPVVSKGEQGLNIDG